MIVIIAAVQSLGRIADRLFEAQMQRVAIRIDVRSQRLPRPLAH
jgi:hypothetical protein